MFDFSGLPLVASSFLSTLLILMGVLTAAGLYLHVHVIASLITDFLFDGLSKLHRRVRHDPSQRSVPVQGPRP
jgi:hypothetical protein